MVWAKRDLSFSSTHLSREPNTQSMPSIRPSHRVFHELLQPRLRHRRGVGQIWPTHTAKLPRNLMPTSMRSSGSSPPAEGKKFQATSSMPATPIRLHEEPRHPTHQQRS